MCLCREQALELLRRGWPAGDDPRYDPDHALMLCRMMSFRPGLTFLYENLRLFREVLQASRKYNFFCPELKVFVEVTTFQDKVTYSGTVVHVTY